MSVQLEEMANVLFNQGLFLRKDHYLVTKHKMTFLVTQCFKCQGFNHITKSCKREAKCRHCIGQHNTSKCTKDLPKKYINCKADHKTWSKTCSIKQMQQKKAAVIKTFMLTYYANTHKTPVNGQQPQPQYEIITKKAS